jgi:DNA gyrase subunit A
LQPGERLAALLPAGRGANIALLSAAGFVRVLPAHVVGQSMNPGTALYRAGEYGPLAAACWTGGQGDLFVATRRGMAIRFAERAIPLSGGQAIRLEAGDAAVAVEAVRPPEGEAIFLLGADGRGTIRLMSGFAANKSPGGSGKLAMKTDHLVAAVAVEPTDDVFAISRLSKIIRFRAGEVPAKEGVVQGVNCMSLRGDEVVAVTATPSQTVAAEGGA